MATDTFSRKNTTFTLVKAVGCSAAIGNAKKSGPPVCRATRRTSGVKIISHEKTQAHLDVSIAFGRWKAGQRTDRVQEQASDTEATFWRNDLLPIINIVKTLAMTRLALRGQHEHAGDSDCYGGIFVALSRQGPQMRYCLSPSATRRHWQPFICALRGQRRGTVDEARYMLYTMKFGKLLKGICTTSN